MRHRQCISLLLVLSFQLLSHAQDRSAFSWINPLNKAQKEAAPGLSHHTIKSDIIGEEVGYCVYLPPGYHKPENRKKRYPVIYMLHGGKLGNETRYAPLIPQIHAAIKDEALLPAIVVLNNGGPISHYNVPGQNEISGKDLFLKELIPLIDREYRTIADRKGRALSGYSMGGRGTARIGFEHPELFSQLVIGSPGADTEKHIQENGGKTNEDLVLAPGDDMWTYAEAFAAEYKGKYPMAIFLYAGDSADRNHSGTVAYSAFLTQLGLLHEIIILPNQKHGGSAIQRIFSEIFNFHNYFFEKTLQQDRHRDQD